MTSQVPLVPTVDLVACIILQPGPIGFYLLLNPYGYITSDQCCPTRSSQNDWLGVVKGARNIFASLEDARLWGTRKFVAHDPGCGPGTTFLDAKYVKPLPRKTGVCTRLAYQSTPFFSTYYVGRYSYTLSTARSVKGLAG